MGGGEAFRLHGLLNWRPAGTDRSTSTIPTDYDGILIGAPVVNRTWGHAAVAWDFIAANLEPGHKLSDAKLNLLHNAAVSVCSAKGNGLKSDPFISDPTECDFYPCETHLPWRGVKINA